MTLAGHQALSDRQCPPSRESFKSSLSDDRRKCGADEGKRSASLSFSGHCTIRTTSLEQVVPWWAGGCRIGSRFR